MKRRFPMHSSQSGVSLIEVVLVSAILTLLAKTLGESSDSMSRMTNRGSTRTLLQIEGHKTMDALIEGLGHSSVRTLNGKSYPFTFDDADAGVQFSEHTHALPTMEAQDGDSDFGTLREVVFVLPADLDSDGRPDMDVDLNGVPELDGDGDGVRSESFDDIDGLWDPLTATIDSETGVVWDHTEHSIVLVTDSDGVNRLQRRLDGDATTAQTIATHVERIQVDSPATSLWTIPLNSLRIQVFFRRLDSRGVLFSHTAEVVVALKNP